MLKIYISLSTLLVVVDVKDLYKLVNGCVVVFFYSNEIGILPANKIL
jgi:hypothetical protein